jgi:alkylhydroperoxidase/carboxymuconolactone decarboxylase family protein YurZ
VTVKQFLGVRFEEVLDPKTKELVLLAASAVSGCKP